MRCRALLMLLTASLVTPVLTLTAAPAAGQVPDVTPAPTAQPRAIDDGCPDGQIQEDGFPDVASSNVHEAAVDCVVHWQVANGRTASAYGPGAPVDRAQMASFIARLVERSGGSLPTASRDWFGDDGGGTHHDNINRLAEAGIVSGTRPGSYGPQQGVTRAQMAAFLTRAYDYRAGQAGQAELAEGDNYFDDDDASPLHDEINTAAAVGFAGGYGDGTYRPDLTVPRDQMGAFLARALDLVVERGMAGVPEGPRSLTDTGWQPYASVGPVALHSPGDVVELTGYHQAGPAGALRQEPVPGAARSLVMGSRNRGTDPQSAADLVVDPSREVRSPVSGRVVRAGNYALYCRHPDQFLVIEPDARPGWEVKVLHFEGLRVAAGDRVEAGVTVVADRARLLPFRSQVDDHTRAPHWPHLHVEVIDLAVPKRPGSGGGC